MTDREYAHHAPRFERDVAAHGLRVALESFLDRYAEYAPRFSTTAGVRALAEAVAANHSVRLSHLMRITCRASAVVRARHETWQRLHASGYSDPQIADWWRCNPSSVCTARATLRVQRPELVAEIEATRERTGLRLVADEGDRRAA